MLKTREEAIYDFLQSCKAIQPYSEYINVEIYNDDGFSAEFGLRSVEEVKKTINDYPKCTFKVSNTICLDRAFRDELFNN